MSKKFALKAARTKTLPPKEESVSERMELLLSRLDEGFFDDLRTAISKKSKSPRSELRTKLGGNAVQARMRILKRRQAEIKAGARKPVRGTDTKPIISPSVKELKRKHKDPALAPKLKYGAAAIRKAAYRPQKSESALPLDETSARMKKLFEGEI